MSGFLQIESSGGGGPPTGAAGGDLGGTYPNPTVASVAGGFKLHVTSISHTNSPYSVLSTDYIIATDSTLGTITITLPAAPSTGVIYQIKDSTGQAAANNVTISGNGHNIDAASIFVINVAYGSIAVIFNGTIWMVL